MKRKSWAPPPSFVIASYLIFKKGQFFTSKPSETDRSQCDLHLGDAIICLNFFVICISAPVLCRELDTNSQTVHVEVSDEGICRYGPPAVFKYIILHWE